MTSEILIMNKEAVALAADSAATVQLYGTDQKKIFTSSNKIFQLSKNAPVAIMVYQNSSLMGIPWETIVKMYREHLKEQTYPALKDYVDNFFQFVSGFINEKMQVDFFAPIIRGLFQEIAQGIQVKANEIIGTEGGIDEERVKMILKSTINNYFNLFEKCELFPAFLNDEEGIFGIYRSVWEPLIINEFQSLTLDEEDSKHLLLIATFWLTRNINRDDYSGVVITGFGEQELFPSAHSFLFQRVLLGKLVFQEESKLWIDYSNQSCVKPFAQSEMTHAFMTGITTNFENQIMQSFANIIENKCNKIIQKNEEIKSNTQPQMQEFIEGIKLESINDWQNQIGYLKHAMSIAPAIKIVEYLPKDELALMAETLVNLNSFKKRISLDAETIGGPIDVAVISKKDGLIWIRRKHYFDPSLNSQYKGQCSK